MPTKAEIQEKYDALEKENAELKRLLGRAERELNNQLLDSEKPPADMPCRINVWMQYHKMPWEVFWCFDHNEWVTELDSGFPYFMELNRCEKCRSR